MADTKFSGLPAADALTGDEIVPVVQGGASKRTTAQAIANLGGGSGTVTHHGTVATVVETSSTTFVATLPSSDAGDLLLLSMGAGIDPVTITPPVGWELLLKAKASQHVFWKVSDGVEVTATFTLSAARLGTATVSRFSGQSTSKPFGVPQLRELASNTTIHTGATTFGKEGSVGVSMVAGLWGLTTTYTINAEWGTPVKAGNTSNSGLGTVLATATYDMDAIDLIPSQNWICGHSLNYSCISVSVLPA